MTAHEFRLPDLGEGLTESDVVTWHVAVGDTVELNQVIAEVETAKALVELPSPFAGVVAALHAREGQTVAVGEPLVTFEVSDDVGAKEPPRRPLGPPHTDPAHATITAPAGSEPADPPLTTPAQPTSAGPAGATLTDPAGPTLVGYGAAPERGGHPARRPRRYATTTAHSAAPHAASGAAPGGHPTAGAAPRSAHALLPAEVTPLADLPAAERARSTPGVRAFARRLGVDLSAVRGTGPDGRVTRQDVEVAAGSASEAARDGVGDRGGGAGFGVGDRAVAVGLGSRDAFGGGDDVRSPVRGVRKHTAAAMVASAFTAPQASVLLTVDATASMELLGRLRDHPLARGERVTVLTLVAHAVCTLLRSHRALASRWVDLPDGSAEIVRPARVSLGIAVATDRGLVVPNIPAADTLGLADLAGALTELTRTAREGRTPPERLTGGTFTITNIGVFGVDAGTPILNPGESGILGLGAVRRRPWEHDGVVALRDVVTLSLTFDHRVVDGEQAARFLADLGAVLGDPALALLLDVDPAASRWSSLSKPPDDPGVVSTGSTTAVARTSTTAGAGTIRPGGAA